MHISGKVHGQGGIVSSLGRLVGGWMEEYAWIYA